MKSLLRVIHIIGGGEFGGAEDHIIHLLKELRKEEVSSEVICFYDSLFAEALRENQIPVEVLSYGRFDIRLLFGLTKLLKEKKPDIVHTHGVKANFFGRIAAKKVKIPLNVTTIHSILKYDYAHFAYRLAAFLENSTRHKNDYYIAISNEIKKQLLIEHVNPDDIQVIYHGIDTEKFAPKEDEQAKSLARQWGKDADTFLVGAVGRLQTVKGFSYFIEAAAKLHKENQGTFRFVLIGEGPKRAELESLVEEKGLGDVFHFAGFRSDVESCLRALNCYVSSSLSEGLGLSVMEALATGTPVVTTGVGGVNDFARNKSNCLVIAPKDVDELTDAVRTIYNEKDLANQLSEQAVQDIRASFSLEKMGKMTASQYGKWLGRK